MRREAGGRRGEEGGRVEAAKVDGRGRSKSSPSALHVRCIVNLVVRDETYLSPLCCGTLRRLARWIE